MKNDTFAVRCAVTEYFTLFGIGGIAYTLIEMLWRGHSHGSMFILGGLCFLAVWIIDDRTGSRAPLPLKMLLCAAAITLLEFCTGFIVNIKLGLHVWSYISQPYNVMGQVCLKYAMLWFVLSGICIAAHRVLKRSMF